VNALPNRPDFIVFTGDLTHTTDDPQEMGSSAGRALKEFKRALGELGEKAPKIRDVSRRGRPPARRGVVSGVLRNGPATDASASREWNR